MIRITKSPSADTRSADHLISKQELLDSTRSHISDVRRAMAWLAQKIINAAVEHDKTKMSCFDEFFRQFRHAQETGHWGIGWYDQIHIQEERHHLNDNCPDDVNLIDVLEMICDGVMAGMARSGKYRYEPISNELLQKAYENTIKMLLKQVEVVGNEQPTAKVD